MIAGRGEDPDEQRNPGCAEPDHAREERGSGHADRDAGDGPGERGAQEARRHRRRRRPVQRPHRPARVRAAHDRRRDRRGSRRSSGPSRRRAPTSADAQVGDVVRIPLPIAEFGRNAIQTAKQVLIQRVREAERDRVFKEYSDKVGTLVRGVVQQVDRGNVIVKLDFSEGVLPAREQIPRSYHRQNDYVRAVVIDVDKAAKGPQVILSRTHPDFLRRLFESEVPEIADEHRRGQGGLARGRRALEDLGVLDRPARGRGRLVRRPEGLARAEHRARAGRRAHRHRAVVVRRVGVRLARAGAGARHGREGAARPSSACSSSSPTTSSRWRSARAARTRGSPRG